MVGTPGSNGKRKEGMPIAWNTPRNGVIAKETGNSGRMTPVRGLALNGDNSNYTTVKAGWGYDTPTNKILNNIPVTVTNRSSERRRRIKTEANDLPTAVERPNFGPPAPTVDPRFIRGRTPTYDSLAPRIRDRSDSIGSAKSENIAPPLRKLAKVSSFTSDRPLLASPLLQTNKKDSFFHAKDRGEKRGGEEPEMFFFAANKAKNVNSPAVTTTNALKPRRLSNSSQFSSFAPAKDVVCKRNSTASNVSVPLSTPTRTSPTKPAFFHVSGSAPESPTFPKQSSPPSPLRSTFTSSPPEKVTSLSPEIPQEPPVAELSTSDSTTPAPEISDPSETEDERTTKSLLPTTSDLEDTARVNRKIADLEISNASLLAVNKNLERLTHEQSQTIKSLRKQLRQSLRMSMIPNPNAATPAIDIEESSSDEESDDEGEELVDKSLEKSLWLVDQMLTEGKKGLEYRVRTSELPSGGRVLSGEWNREHDLDTG